MRLTPLLLECLDSLLPCITAVFNNSLVSGVFPSVYKSALVKPLLKKMSLDPDDFSVKSLRKNSSISAKRTLEPQQPSQSFRSAYRPNHSTETALLRIVNDLPTAMDNNKICILTLLDLSAAFDTIVHQKLSLPDFSTLLAFQKVQNAAARFVCKAKKYDHIHPILETLQWLPITHRIQYKIPTASVPSLEQPLSICPISFNLILQQDNYDLHLTHEPLSLYSSKTITICI